MTYAEWVRFGALYFPLLLALIAGVLRRRQRKLFAGCLLSVLWTAPTLLILQHCNVLAGWWRYADSDVMFLGMPLELYLGWMILWGLLPQLAFRKLPIWLCAILMAVLDLVAMPLCKPVVQLGSRWLAGEAVAVLIVLVPALCIARWTMEGSHLHDRSTLQVAISGMLFLYFLPELVFALRPGLGWGPFLEMLGWQRQLSLQFVALIALPAVGAVMEFAQRGSGTPIPYDPPIRLVTSGIYRYCANPMQLSCALVMLAWAALLRNWWLILVPAVSVVYSAGIAEWDEAGDLSQRFGADWRKYREKVRNWIPRWRPYHAGASARLFVAATCGPCSELRLWIEARRPVGLEIVDAETLPQGSIRRMRYDPGDNTGEIEGVRAFGRVLEHLNLGWAIAGIALRLPLVWQFVQLVMDSSGLGPRCLIATPQNRS